MRVAVIALGLTLAACSSTSTPTAVPRAVTPTTAATATPPSDATALVTTIALTSSDVAAADLETKDFPAGSQVTGQVTLDYCGDTFSTEKLRVARLQRAIVNSVDPTVDYSNEVVAYSSEAAATQALQQFRTAIKTCPKGRYVDQTVEGVPALEYTGAMLVAQALPVPDHAVAAFEVTAKGTTQHAFAVILFQRSGAVLDGIYVQSASALLPGQLTQGIKLAKAAGAKLLAAHPS